MVSRNKRRARPVAILLWVIAVLTLIVANCVCLGKHRLLNIHCLVVWSSYSLFIGLLVPLIIGADMSRRLSNSVDQENASITTDVSINIAALEIMFYATIIVAVADIR